MSNAAVRESIDGVRVETEYLQHSLATGAMIHFLFITDSSAIDFTKSAVVSLGVNTSLEYVLPFNLGRGQYKVRIYDIEARGTLNPGLNYPAVRSNLVINQDRMGMTLRIVYSREKGSG